MQRLSGQLSRTSRSKFYTDKGYLIKEVWSGAYDIYNHKVVTESLIPVDCSFTDKPTLSIWKEHIDLEILMGEVRFTSQTEPTKGDKFKLVGRFGTANYPDKTFEIAGCTNRDVFGYACALKAVNLGTPILDSSPAVPAPVVTPWYLTDGVVASDIVRAYQSKGAASLADSYINLVTPGTGDAIATVPPTWDAINGRKYNGTDQYLNTGFSATENMAMFIMFSNSVTLFSPMFGSVGIDAFSYFMFVPNQDDGTSTVDWGAGTHTTHFPVCLSGVICVYKNNFYVDGVLVATGSGVWTDSVLSILIGSANDGATPSSFHEFYEQAFLAIEKSDITPTQIAALSANMAAL